MMIVMLDLTGREGALYTVIEDVPAIVALIVQSVLGGSVTETPAEKEVESVIEIPTGRGNGIETKKGI